MNQRNDKLMDGPMFICISLDGNNPQSVNLIGSQHSTGKLSQEFLVWLHKIMESA